jgi:two-component system response regulator GlrR
MENVLHQARLVAQSEASVFIQGASGTGKELLARAIHRASRRSQGPFVAVNCAAIPENLLESELFGHRKGSFTGASYDHKGLIPAADQGTLFLDEIGDMPFALQAKLLRVLQDREVRAVGATQGAPVDVRIISATHRDLDAQMKEGRFREDLYYRLNVVSVETPPLRDRKDDIPELAEFFVKRFAGELKKRVEGISPDAQKLLSRHNWPGNIRELENVIERAVLLADGPLVHVTDLQIGEQASSSSGSGDRALAVRIPPTGIPLEEIERQAVVEALKMSNWVQKDAAELLGISPRVMNYKIKILNIEIPRGRRAVAETMAS